jgi:hypothetical protein
MPSGITSDLYEGKDTTLRGYLMSVGRSMGYAIMQRDEHPAAAVTEVTASTYHAEAAAKSRQALADLEQLTVAQAWDLAVGEREEAEAKRREHVQKNRDLRARYTRMLAEVEAWEPDPLVASTKDHALKALRESLDFDCGPEGEELRYWPKPALDFDGAAYITRRRAELQKDIEYHDAEQCKEDQRTIERNRHIAAFLGSLPAGVEGNHAR